MTTVNGWESLVVDTKIYILVALGVLDSPLCEIKMSKFCEIYLKMTQWWVIFQIIAAVV